MKMKRVIFYCIICGFTFYSCLDNINTDIDPVYYNPTFSIPIGPLSYSLHDIMPYHALNEYIPDTISPDTNVSILIYDDSLMFENPEDGYDTVFIEALDMNSVTDQWEYIRSLMFRVQYTNGLPVNTAIQLYFLGVGNTLIDSLYEDGRLWIQSAEVNNDGIVTVPTQELHDTYVDEAEINSIMQATQMLLYIFLETYQNDTLRVYSDYHFDLHLGVRAELMIPIE